MQKFIKNIEELTLSNSNFRKVIFTGQHAQLVLMSLLPKEAIGTEVHTTTDQFLRIEKGDGKVVIDGTETIVKSGTAIFVPAGAKHNLINTSVTESMQLYTIYSPPHHKDGIIHKTKQAAESDTTDHL